MRVRLPAPPGKAAVALPVAYMVALALLSSVRGTPQGPATDAWFQGGLWLSPGLQNLLHVPAYMGLTLAWRWALAAWTDRIPLLTWGSALLAIGFGVADEVHQAFVPGRFATAGDAFLNALGVLLGLMVGRRWAQGDPAAPDCGKPSVSRSGE